MIPVFGGKVEEGEQSFPVLRQAGDRFLVLGAVFFREHIDSRLGLRAGWRAVDFTKPVFMLAWTEKATLFSTLAVLWTQHR